MFVKEGDKKTRLTKTLHFSQPGQV